MAEKGKKSDDFTTLVGIGIVVALLVAIPAALALLVWLATSRWIARKECVALFGVGAVAWALWPVEFVTGYWNLLAGLVTGDITLASVPWGMLAASVSLLMGAYGLLLSTRIGSKVPKSLKGAAPSAGTLPAITTVVPSAEEKTRMVPARPDGAVLVTKDAHAIQGGQEVGKRRFPLGIGVNGTVVTLGEDDVRTHGVILGATGSGKTETIKALAGALLDLGWSGMVLDLKEDTAAGGLRDWCNTYAHVHSLPYQELRLSDRDPAFWFNPLSGIGPDEIRDMILSLNTFDDAYWQAINKELLGQAVNLLVWAHQAAPDMFPEPTMYELGRVLSTGSLKEATKKMRAVVLGAGIPGVTEEDFRTLATPSQAHQQSASGFGAKMTLIYDTQAGRTVLRAGNDGKRRLIDVTAPGVVYIGLDSLGKADLTRVISSSVLQRMSVYASVRATGQETGPDAKAPRFMIVDEANWVDRKIVQNLLSRARSAGIAMFLCTQGPEDWIDENGDDWGRLSQNTNVAIIMRQGSPRAAELCADYIGTHDVVKKSSSRRVTTNVFGGTRVVRDENFSVLQNEMEREMEEHLVPPETVRQMGIGEAVLKVGTKNRVEWLRVQMRDPAARVH